MSKIAKLCLLWTIFLKQSNIFYQNSCHIKIYEINRNSIVKTKSEGFGHFKIKSI